MLRLISPAEAVEIAFNDAPIPPDDTPERNHHGRFETRHIPWQPAERSNVSDATAHNMMAVAMLHTMGWTRNIL